MMFTEDPYPELSHAYEELQENLPDIELWQSHADGEALEVFVSETLGNEYAGLSHFATSYSHIPVDVISDRTQPAGWAVEGNDTATERLKEIADANSLDLEEPSFRRKTCAQGIGYIMVYPDADGNPQMHFNDAKCVRVFYDVADPRVATHAIKAWQEGKIVRANMIYPDRIEKFYSEDDAKTWEPFIVELENGTEEAWPLPHPWLTGSLNDRLQLPVFAFPLPDSKPVHIHAIPAQNSLNKLQAVKILMAEGQGLPSRIALTEDDSGGGTSAYDRETLYNDGPEGTDTRDSKVSLRPGQLTFLDNIKNVIELSPGSTADNRADKAEAKQEMADSCGIPLRYFADPGGQMPAADSQRQAEIRLINKVSHIQRLLEASWMDVWIFAYFLDSGEVLPAVTTHWQASPVTILDKTFWEAAQIMQTMGVPKRQILLDAGFSEELVASWGYTNVAPNGGVAAPDVAKPVEKGFVPVAGEAA
jgi:hypothetical protein